MDTTSYIALSRQMALERNMAQIANNIANAATNGYQAEHTLFEQVLERAGVPKKLAFVQDVGLYRDLSPGPISTTGNRLDVAVHGEGYLAFQTRAGVRYARSGHLELDQAGQIIDADGNALLDSGGAPIVLPPNDRDLSIAEDGTISTAGGIVTQLQPVTFANEQAMVREGNGFYRTDQPPQPATARIIQGALEDSNVSSVLEMTAMIDTTRAFEATQRLIETQHELDRKGIERILQASA